MVIGLALRLGECIGGRTNASRWVRDLGAQPFGLGIYELCAGSCTCGSAPVFLPHCDSRTLPVSLFGWGGGRSATACTPEKKNAGSRAGGRMSLDATGGDGHRPTIRPLAKNSGEPVHGRGGPSPPSVVPRYLYGEPDSQVLPWTPPQQSLCGAFRCMSSITGRSSRLSRVR